MLLCEFEHYPTNDFIYLTLADPIHESNYIDRFVWGSDKESMEDWLTMLTTTDLYSTGFRIEENRPSFNFEDLVIREAIIRTEQDKHRIEIPGSAMGFVD